jgi:hypothetical protein
LTISPLEIGRYRELDVHVIAHASIKFSFYPLSKLETPTHVMYPVL